VPNVAVATAGQVLVALLTSVTPAERQFAVPARNSKAIINIVPYVAETVGQ